MIDRRSFLISMSAALLPVGNSFACPGEFTVDRLTVPIKNPPFKNQPLSEFITQYIGNPHWIMDNEQLIGAKIEPGGIGNTNDGKGYIVEDNLRWIPKVLLPEEREGFKCSALDLILECVGWGKLANPNIL